MTASRYPQHSDRDDSDAAAVQTALVDALGQSAFVVMGVFTRIAAEHDLSLTQLRVLGILRDRRLRMAQLADFLGLDKSTLSGLVERAERRGLLSRARSADDRRAVDVVITEAGNELADKLQNEVRRVLAPMTDRLSAAQQRSLTHDLRASLASPQGR